jgi:hypothetical protein
MGQLVPLQRGVVQLARSEADGVTVEMENFYSRLAGLYKLSSADPQLERRLVSTLAPIK